MKHLLNELRSAMLCHDQKRINVAIYDLFKAMLPDGNTAALKAAVYGDDQAGVNAAAYDLFKATATATTEDETMVERLANAPERTVHYVEVGGLSLEEAANRTAEVREGFAKQSSDRLSSLASETLADPEASARERSLAASVLSQDETPKPKKPRTRKKT